MFHDIDSATPATTPQPPVTTPPPPATTTGNNAKIIFALLWPLNSMIKIECIGDCFYISAGSGEVNICYLEVGHVITVPGTF